MVWGKPDGISRKTNLKSCKGHSIIPCSSLRICISDNAICPGHRQEISFTQWAPVGEKMTQQKQGWGCQHKSLTWASNIFTAKAKHILSCMSRTGPSSSGVTTPLYLALVRPHLEHLEYCVFLGTPAQEWQWHSAASPTEAHINWERSQSAWRPRRSWESWISSVR